MKIEYLEEFMCLASMLNYGAAAKKCFISQSTLSKHINALERELDCQLFERTNRQVALTPIGEALKENASAVLEAYDKCLNVVDQMKNAAPSRLDVGYLYAASHRFITGVYGAFSEAHPDAQVRFIRGQGEILMQNLRNGTFDLVFDMDFGEYDSSWFETAPLYRDSYGIILPQDHPLAQSGEIALSDLAEETFILPSRRYFESHWLYLHHALTEELGEGIKMKDVLSDPDELAMYVRRGDGAGLLVGHAIHTTDMTGMAFVPIAGDPFAFNVCAIWRRADKSATLRQFVNTTKALFRSAAFRAEALPPLP